MFLNQAARNVIHSYLPKCSRAKVASFLKQVERGVLKPEFEASEGHGYSREISQEAQSLIRV